MKSSPSDSLKASIRKLPNKPGVYVMYNRFKQILYVGKAKALKKRVSSYFQASRKMQIAQPKISALIEQIDHFEYYTVQSESEALLLESQLIKKYKPKYNTSLKDDKRFLLVQVNLAETLPRFRLARNRIYKHYRYYGPFPHAGALRKTLEIMKKKFGILLMDAKPQKIDAIHWQLYDDARAELSKLPNLVTSKAYRQRVDAACEFLEGHSEKIIYELREKMHALAQRQAYEKAGVLRDQITAIQQTSKRTRKFERNLIGFISEAESVKCLKEALSLKQRPSRIECFDISHISGSFCVASMVCFIDGKPKRKEYRRYKIKSFIGNDDFKAISEVVGRRYARLNKENVTLPDLIVIDGGKGQVHAAVKALYSIGLKHAEIIGLAKKKETIVFPYDRPNLNLPLRDPALRLLQYLRDEAHDYANNFNAELRSRKIRESLLDEYKGLGEKRKTALLRHFGSIQKIQKASPEELTAVDGIGMITAKHLSEFLAEQKTS